VKPKRFQDVLGVQGELLELVVGGLGGRELHELHLVELVLADESPRVLPVGSRLAAKARRVGHVVDGQVLLAQDLVAVDVRDGDLGRGDHVVVHPFDLEEVLGELRELPRAGHALLVDHEGREDLQVGVLEGVQVEHVVDEGPFELGAPAAIQGEARPRDLCPAGKVQDLQILADVPVGLGLEVECWLFAPVTDDGVVLGAGAVLDGVVLDVGDDHDETLDVRIHLGQLRVEGLDPIRDGRHLRHEFRGVLFLLLQSPDLLGGLVALAPQGLHLLEDVPAALFGVDEGRKVDILPPLEHLAADEFGVFTKEFDVQHSELPPWLSLRGW